MSEVSSPTAAAPSSNGVVDPPGPPILSYTNYPLGVRAVNAIGRVARAFGQRWPRIDADALVADARKRTRLQDMGDDLYRDGLQTLVDCFNATTEPHAFGRHVFRESCIKFLSARLRIQDELKRHPEILDVPLERPLIITGLPRSGTTFLHRLMSEDPAGRTLLYWETLNPAPSPRVETYATDPRIAEAEKYVKTINRLAPQVSAGHYFAATEPEECNNLFCHEFRAAFFGFLFDVPGYIQWLNEQDRVPGYRSMKRQLQLLSLHVRRDYWVLKAPAHLFGLGAMLKVYPDACIVQTHRSPRKVVPSVSKLASGFRSLTMNPLDYRRIGHEFARALARAPEFAMQDRAGADPSRFFDVRYEALVADPVGTVRAICKHFGYDFTPDYEARTRRYLAENPQHKHGTHKYTLEDFGLDPATIDAHFADYNAWVERNVPTGVG